MKPIIIGGGLAGLTVALSLFPMPVILVSPRKLGEDSASLWAQGGIAAAVGVDDSPAIHTSDTLAAGAGLCDPSIVQTVTEDGARVIASLIEKAVSFDRNESGQLSLGLEAAHSRRRIVHSVDATGSAIMKALVAAARSTPSIEIVEDATCTEILTVEKRVTGIVLERYGDIINLIAQSVVLATGGCGALWQQTTNPLGSWGRGLALAARAGAVLGDLEFMQFHPTCIDIGRDPMPLASEALRGEGCTLIDDQGQRFVDELQPRDVVARAIWLKKTSGSKVFLDARKALGVHFAEKFPTITATCITAGLNPAESPIPVSPGAHYHMGGVVTNPDGQTSIEGLWACGEVACTGLHGANRLASNSLLEAASYGRNVANSISGTKEQKPSSAHLKIPTRQKKNAVNASLIRNVMSRHVGVMRDAKGLQSVVDEFAPIAIGSDMALVGLMIALLGSRRKESRGAHARTDFQETSIEWQRRQQITLDDLQSLFAPYKERRRNRG